MDLYRCREKQRKEASRLQAVNRKLTAMNKLLMEENDRLQKQVSQLVYENSYFRQQTQNVNSSIFFNPSGYITRSNLICWKHFCIWEFVFSLLFFVFFNFKWWILSLFLVFQATDLATTDTSCESVVISGQLHLTPQNQPRDASPAGLVEWLASFFLSFYVSFSFVGSCWVIFCPRFVQSPCFVNVWLANLLVVYFPDFCPLQRRL